MKRNCGRKHPNRNRVRAVGRRTPPDSTVVDFLYAGYRRHMDVQKTEPDKIADFAIVDEAVEKLEADGFLIGFERAQEIYRNSYGELVRRYASESSETESSGGL